MFLFWWRRRPYHGGEAILLQARVDLWHPVVECQVHTRECHVVVPVVGRGGAGFLCCGVLWGLATTVAAAAATAIGLAIAAGVAPETPAEDLVGAASSGRGLVVLCWGRRGAGTGRPGLVGGDGFGRCWLVLSKEGTPRVWGMMIMMMIYNRKKRDSTHQLGFSKGRHGAHSEW
jgi:hypothetical protein